MYTVYIQRVTDFARREYLRSLRYRSWETSLDDLPENKSPQAEEPRFANELAFGEDRLSRAVSEMPLLRRQVLILLFMEQLSAQEIAARLGCSVNYVYKQKHLALQKIKEVMNNGEHEQ